MKKRIVLALLAIVLVMAVVGGGVYGKNIHHKAQGNKLVGFGRLGVLNIPNVINNQYNSFFFFTNPDDETDIAITQVSVISGNGTVVYEGPYVITLIPSGTREVVSMLKPHEIRAISLSNYMWTGAGDPEDPTDPANWLPVAQANSLPPALYTVQIYWEPVIKKGATVPLAGWVETNINQLLAGGHTIILSTDMENMVQR